MEDKTVEEPKNVFEYEGMISSAVFTGKAKLTVETDGLVIDGLFNRSTIAYADMESAAVQDYTVSIKAGKETVSISRMGQACEWFTRDLADAFNRKVLSAFNISCAPDLETQGQYFFDGLSGKAAIRLYPDCLCILPPTLSARRIPLVFVTDMKQDGYSLILTLTTGEVYSFTMLGFDLEPLEKKIADHIRKLKNNNVEFIKKLIPALGFSESNLAATSVTEGVAVQLKLLPAALATIMDQKAMNSRMGIPYSQLKTLCDSGSLAIGIKSLPEEEVELLKQKLLESMEKESGEAVELTPEQGDALRWVVWAVIVSKDHKTAVVEFAIPGEDAATYLFHVDGEWEHFLALLNRGMEATRLEREAFSLSDETLKSESYAAQRMIVMRTPALAELRKCYAGRVIHRSAESWKSSLLEKLDKASQAEFQATTRDPGFCRYCGKKLTAGMKFCGECGAKLLS